MTRIRLVPWALVLAVAVLLGPAAVPAGAGEDDPTVQREYDEVVGQEAEALERLDAARQAREGYRAEALLLDARLQETRSQLETAEQRLLEADTVADRAERALERAEAKVERANDQLRRQAVHSYMFGEAAASRPTLLGPANEVGRVRVYSDAVADHQRRLIDELESAEKERDRLADEASAARDDATRSRDELADAEALVEAQHREQLELADMAAQEEANEAAILLDLQTRKIALEARITQMQRDSDGLGMLIAAAQQGQPDWTAYAVTTVDPLPGVPMTSPFGMRFHPVLHYERLHAGQDLSAPTGTPILAAADGTVLVASERGGYGNTVVIDHGHSLSTLYGHLSKLLVSPGQPVKAGQVIGLVGSTGMSTGPHLHFETRVRGVPVDPTYFVSRP